MRTVLDACCWLLHRMWWVPVWNRSLFLNCPTAWLCNRFDRFNRWFWQL